MRPAISLLLLLVAAPALAGERQPAVAATLLLESPAASTWSAGPALITLSIDPQGNVFLGGRSVPGAPGLGAVLRSNMALQMTRRVALSIDGAVPTARLFEILAELRAGGVERVALLGPSRPRAPIPARPPRPVKARPPLPPPRAR